MKQAVANAIEELKKAFPSSEVYTEEDGSGGAYVIVEDVEIGDRYEPSLTWVGGRITAPPPLRRHLSAVHQWTGCVRVDGVAFGGANHRRCKVSPGVRRYRSRDATPAPRPTRRPPWRSSSRSCISWRNCHEP